MSSKSSQLSVRADRLLEPWAAEVLALLDAALRELECPYVLVGATARDILLVHVFGLPAMRATLDIDIGVAVESWNRFTAVRNRLLARGFVENPKIIHRLRVKSAHAAEPISVDIIPFGGIARSGQRIEWPTDPTRVMNVAAFEEARSSSLEVRVNPNLAVPVASLPGLAALKLVAWNDRQSEKDASDLLCILRQYSNAGNLDRLYEPDDGLPILESAGHSVERAAAILLGRDVRRLSSSLTATEIAELLNSQKNMETLSAQMPGAVWDQTVAAEAEDLLNQFIRGFNLEPADPTGATRPANQSAHADRSD